MTLQPGCRLVVAPHFHLPGNWPVRLRIGGRIEEIEGRFFPCGPWRPPTAEELALLTEGPADLQGCVCLFQLPGHLRAQWWELLAQAASAAQGSAETILGAGLLPGFEAFVGRVEQFLAFKRLPLPTPARCEAVVSRPGQRSLRWDPECQRPAGLTCNLAPWTPWPIAQEERWPRLWGAINLGDEETALVLVNLPCRQLQAELGRRTPDPASPATVGELTRGFLRLCADYPPLRLSLGPGEGCRLPQGGLILDGCPEAKREADVLLLVSAGEGWPD